MEAEIVTLAGNLGGVGLFAFLVYRLVDSHLKRVEVHLERSAKASEDVGKALVMLAERQQANFEHISTVLAEMRGDITPVERPRVAGLYRVGRKPPEDR